MGVRRSSHARLRASWQTDW